MLFTDSVLKVHLYMCNIDDYSCKFTHHGFKSKILIVLQKGSANHCITHQHIESTCKYNAEILIVSCSKIIKKT